MTIKDDAIKTLLINGYVLLYASATTVAGLMGYGTAYLTERTLHDVASIDTTDYRDGFEFVYRLCILFWSAIFLTVALALYPLDLMGGLPNEYHVVIVQVGTAIFGMVVFSCACLLIMLLAGVVLRIAGIFRGRPSSLKGVTAAETVLLSRCRQRMYGTGHALPGVDLEQNGEDSAAADAGVNTRHDSVTSGHTWIPLSRLSSDEMWTSDDEA